MYKNGKGLANNVTLTSQLGNIYRSTSILTSSPQSISYSSTSTLTSFPPHTLVKLLSLHLNQLPLIPLLSHIAPTHTPKPLWGVCIQFPRIFDTFSRGIQTASSNNGGSPVLPENLASSSVIAEVGRVQWEEEE